AAISVRHNRYSVGYMVMDAKGHFVAVRSQSFEGLVDPKVAKILGVREALSWLK
ncbi:unnamed protein product, partial [Dovyalis caffra]